MALPLLGAVGLASVNSVLGTLQGVFNSPSAMMFARTLSDVTGVIGNTLTPIFRIANTVMRMVGDTLASVAPGFQDLFEIIESAFIELKPVMESVQRVVIVGINTYTQLLGVWWKTIGVIANILGFKDAAATTGQVIETVAKKIITVMKFVEQVVIGIRNFAESGQRFASVSDMWRTAKSNADAAFANTGVRSSFGQGQRTASYMGFEDFAKQARVSAFQSTFGLTRDDKRDQMQAKANEHLEKIVINTDEVKRGIRPQLWDADQMRRSKELHDAVMREHGMAGNIPNVHPN